MAVGDEDGTSSGVVEHRQVGFRGSGARRRRSVAASPGAARDSGLAVLGALARNDGIRPWRPWIDPAKKATTTDRTDRRWAPAREREEEQGERPPSPASAHAGAAACWVRPWGPPAPPHSCAEGSTRPALPHHRAWGRTRAAALVGGLAWPPRWGPTLAAAVRAEGEGRGADADADARGSGGRLGKAESEADVYI